MKRYYKQAVCIVALALLALSLRHLAHGIEQVTGVSSVEAILMAFGIDCAMVALELATLVNIRTAWTRGLIVATCVLSAGFNVLGFLEHAHGVFGQSLAVALGVFVPAAVYGLTDTMNRRQGYRRKRGVKARSKAPVRQLRAV